MQVKNIKPLDGYYDIYGHGNIGIIGLELSGKDDDYFVLNAKNLIYLLKQSKDYKKGTNIRLLSCLAGTDNEKEVSLAQEVANALNVNVIAPDGTNVVELNGNIRVKISKEMSLNTKIEGSIKKFIPKG